MRKKTAAVFGLLVFALARPVAAVCPVCTIAVGAGLGLSRWLKIDDTVSGVWIGGLIVSSGLWFADWLGRKKIKIKGLEIWSVAVMYILVIAPLWRSELVGHPLNKLWGIDKLVVGSVAGVVVFGLAQWLNAWLKRRNNGKVYFPYQKVVVPVLMLMVGSAVFYLVTKT